MLITLSFAQFQAFNPHTDKRMFYALTAGNVTDVAVEKGFVDQTAHFTISNPPLEADFLALYPAALKVSSITEPSGGGGGGGAVTIADGADIAEGATTDVAVFDDNPGTISAKLRGLSTIINSVWFSLHDALNINLFRFGGTVMTVGAKTTAASIPVTLPTNATTLPVSLATQVDSNATGTFNAINQFITIFGTGTLITRGVVGMAISTGANVTAGSLTLNYRDGATGLVAQPCLIWDVVNQVFLSSNVIPFGGLTAANSYLVIVTGGDALVANTSNDWAGTAVCRFDATVKQIPISMVKVTNAITATVSGSVSVSNFPASQNVVVTNTIGAVVSGTVSVNNFPASQPVTIVDGGNVVEGAIADTEVHGDVPGTISAKLRGLSKIFANVWDGTSTLAITLNKVGGATFGLGGSTIASSIPVNIATDQPPILVTATAVPLAPNASKESGGNLDAITELLINARRDREEQQLKQCDYDDINRAGVHTDVFNIEFRQGAR